jgi:hypothetical protein
MPNLEMPRRVAKASPTIALLIALSICAGASAWADPGVNGSYTTGEAVNTKKSIRKVWSNLLAGYQQARNAAKSIVKQMQLTSSLAHSMEQNLAAWESVAQRTEALLHADIWDSNPIREVENLEENLFQKTDALLYDRIPNARQASGEMEKARRQWVDHLGWEGDGAGTDGRKTLLGTLGLVGLSQDQRKQKTREKMAFDVRAASIAKTAARQDRMTFLTDDADSHFSAMGTTLTQMDASEAKALAEMNTQLAENGFVQGQMEACQEMDRLDLYAQILLVKASAYNRAGLASHLAVQPLLMLSDALKSKRRKP